MRAAIGLDGGSTSSKAVLVDESGDVLAKAYQLSRGNPIEDMKHLLTQLREHVTKQSAELEVLGFGATGYAADVLESALSADVNIVETVAHMQSAIHCFGDVDVICDIGGQDIKVLLMRDGDIKDFRLSNQCSAGNGMLLQAMADQFGIPIEQYADHAFTARQSPLFSYGCAVFLDSDRVNFQKEGFSREELLAGLAMVLPKNVWQYVVQIPRMAELGKRYVLQGGTQYNLATVKAQVDYIRQRVPDAEVYVHPHCGESGAIGAALETIRVVQRRGYSNFVGIDRAIDLDYVTRNDESTRCRFCPNLCGRTFVESKRPDGKSSVYISGFSCEKGTVDSKETMQELVKRRNVLKERYVNLVEYESRLAFKSFYEPKPLPEPSEFVNENLVRRGWMRRRLKRPRRRFVRSDEESRRYRQQLRIGIPRVLNLYSTAPLFRTYFETLGIPSRNVCFSPVTTEELYREGAQYGSVDPCFPAKVAQSHLHWLLHKGHKPPTRPLHFVFFPSITHVPTFVEQTMDSTSCPIVAGTPNVMKAAFNKEVPYFERHGIEYVDNAVTLVEPFYFKRQMFEMWGKRLRVTEDESNFAVDQGWEALRCFDQEMQRRGAQVLEEAESLHRVVLLILGRPYHADPGLNHGLLDEFQSLGYPILSIRSIPKDKSWLARWFQDDLKSGRIASPLEIGDVWPENYSTNSVQKVWAAKFAARHPNVAVLDLSSFKCGHDAPTYGLVDEIIKSSKSRFMAMHDLDANKPAGSQKIRVRTYAYSLQRLQEELDDRAIKMTELERSVRDRRERLLAERRRALSGNAHSWTDRQMQPLERAYQAYLDEEESVLGIKLSELERPWHDGISLYNLSADVAPPQPEQLEVKTTSLPVLTNDSAGCGSCHLRCVQTSCQLE